MIVKQKSIWYVKKGRRVQGPFEANEIARFLLLGRVRNTDRVSTDGELWEPVTQVPELIPDELLDFDACAYPVEKPHLVEQPLPPKRKHWIIRNGEFFVLAVTLGVIGFVVGVLS